VACDKPLGHAAVAGLLLVLVALHGCRFLEDPQDYTIRIQKKQDQIIQEQMQTGEEFDVFKAKVLLLLNRMGLSVERIERMVIEARSMLRSAMAARRPLVPQEEKPDGSGK